MVGRCADEPSFFYQRPVVCEAGSDRIKRMSFDGKNTQM
jgi:hypothetical protein